MPPFVLLGLIPFTFLKPQRLKNRSRFTILATRFVKLRIDQSTFCESQMKNIILAAVLGGLVGFCSSSSNQDKPQAKKKMEYVLDFAKLESDREKSKRAYISFFDVDSMHCGIYSLAAGAKDGQNPHTQDEVYFVEEGIAKINIQGTDHDLKPGSIVFVPAYAQHHFHSIKEDLKTLVFFSKLPVKKPADN